MPFYKIILLAIVQGFAELLPISSSAHVIVTEKLLGLKPSSPEMTMLLVMLHTGTMLAVIVYFWKLWKTNFFQTGKNSRAFLIQIIAATACTAVIGLALLFLIEKVIFRHTPHMEIEMLFDNLALMATALAAVGLLILYADFKAARYSGTSGLNLRQSLLIGAAQGICLPFRGFSRSGATISTGMILGIDQIRAEEFSFALAVVLTPPVIIREAWRLLKFQTAKPALTPNLLHVFYPSLLGMVLSFIAGLLALHWLSRWLNQGHWKWFGYYCLVASMVIFWLTR